MGQLCDERDDEDRYHDLRKVGEVDAYGQWVDIDWSQRCHTCGRRLDAPTEGTVCKQHSVRS